MRAQIILLRKKEKEAFDFRLRGLFFVLALRKKKKEAFDFRLRGLFFVFLVFRTF